MSANPRMRVMQFVEGGGRYGAAVSVLNLTKALARRDLEIEFAIFKDRPLGAAVRELGIPVHEVNARKRYDFRGVMHLRRILKERQIDVLHTHLSKATIIGSLAARLSRVPVTATVHGMNKKYTYLMADRIITVSEAGKKYLVDQGVRADKVTAVYNGLDPAPFGARPGRAAARRRIGEPDDAVLFGTVSRAEPNKGIWEAIEAVAILREKGVEARYLFVGDGKQIEDLKSLADRASLSEHVRFAGFQEDIIPWLSAMDVFLFPTKQEAFGISLLEAMACALPIVTTRIGGIPEILDDSCARFAEPGSAASVADAALSLVRDSGLAANLADAAQRRFHERFTIDVSAERAESVYRSMLASAGRVARGSPAV